MILVKIHAFQEEKILYISISAIVASLHKFSSF